MTHTKLTRTLLAGMMTCSMALTTITAMTADPQPVNAAEVAKTNDSTFAVNLYKMKLYDGTQINNTGDPLDLANVEGLAGVQFKYYNITTLFYQVKKAQGLDDNDAVVAYITEHWEDLVDDDLLMGTTGNTGADGLTTIASLPKQTVIDGNPVHSIYLFDEVPSEANADFMISPPFVLGMTDDLAKKDTVTLYAKNYGVQKSLWDSADDATKTELDDDSKAYSFEVGDDINYTSTSPIPANVLTDYTTLRFLDTMSTVGTDLKRVDDIGYYDGGEWHSVQEALTSVAKRHLTSNDNGWSDLQATLNQELTNKVGTLHAGFYYELDVTDSATHDLLQEIAGKQLEFKYTMTINSDATVYEDIDNTFYGIFTNKHGESVSESTPPGVETGGHEFIKINSQTNKGLKGAKFVLRQGTEGNYEYAVFDKVGDDGSYSPEEITWVADPDDATTIESGTDGKIFIKGLKEGSYVLYETAAPAGFTIPNKETAFTVKEGAVGTSHIESKDIANTPDATKLPTTGSMGIAAFVVIGIAAMGTAVVYQKKRKA